MLHLCGKNATYNKQDYKEAEIQSREQENISGCLFCFVMPGVFSECNKACKRGDKRTCTADIDAPEQLGIVCGEPGEKYSAGNVAYNLAG